jgi:hypothetical protein
MSDFKNFDRMFRLDDKVALVTGGTLFPFLAQLKVYS